MKQLNAQQMEEINGGLTQLGSCGIAAGLGACAIAAGVTGFDIPAGIGALMGAVGALGGYLGW